MQKGGKMGKKLKITLHDEIIKSANILPSQSKS